MLTITLDESDCFAAWVSAKDAGFTSPDGSDPKREIRSDPTHRMCLGCKYMIHMKTCVCVSWCVAVNLGGLLLQALLEFWPRTHINPMDEDTELNHTSGNIHIVLHLFILMLLYEEMT